MEKQKRKKKERKERKKLTDLGVRKRKLEFDGIAYEVMDTEIRGLGLRVGGKPDALVKTFFLVGRYPKPGKTTPNPTRRALGRYGEITVEQARAKALEWRALVAKGIDPAVQAEKLRKAQIEAEKKRQAHTFGAALEAYLKWCKASKLRTARAIKNELTRGFAGWMDRPLSDIDQKDVKDVILAIASKGKPAQAHLVYSMVRAFFNWVIDTGDYGLEISPCAKIKPVKLIGARNIRSRVLKDHEIAAYWRASEALGYPFGDLYKLLLLTALRRNEAAGAKWNEFDFNEHLWTIPASRMKGRENKAKPHAVPLVPDIVTLLKGLPRFASGDFIFSTTKGRKKIFGFAKAKERLDALMTADLEKQGQGFEHFTIHDIRRTARTKFSALRVPNEVCEALLAHAKPGLNQTYDLHDFLPEKTEALAAWHRKLRDIIDPNTAAPTAKDEAEEKRQRLSECLKTLLDELQSSPKPLIDALEKAGLTYQAARLDLQRIANAVHDADLSHVPPDQKLGPTDNVVPLRQVGT